MAQTLTDAVPGGAPTASTARRTVWARAGLTALVVLPVVVAIVAALTSDHQLAGDWALLELRVRDVGTSDTPLVGPFSRYGWNHPGPLLFWLLAIPYRLLGSSPDALLVAAGLVNGAALVGTSILVWRRGRWPLLVLASLAFALLLDGVGAGFLIDPWNPYVTMLPFALLVVIAWSITCGDARLLPLAVVVAAFLVQTHVGYAPVVGALLGWALLGLWFRWRSPADDAELDQTLAGEPVAGDDATRDPITCWLIVSAVLAVVLGVPVIVEQLTHDPGNLLEVVRHFTDRGAPTAGFSRAARIVGQHLAIPGIWTTGDEPLDPFVGELVGGTAWWVVPALAALGAAGWVAWRRRLGDATRLVVTVAVLLVVGFVSISRTTGEVYPYLFQWMRPIALLLWLSVAWVAYLAVPERWQRTLGSWGGPVAVGLTAVVTLFTCLSPTRLVIEEGPVDDAVAAVAPETIAAVGDSAVLIWPVGGCLDWVANGLVVELERAGVDVRAAEGDAHRYGDHRTYDGTNADRSVVVACRGAIDELADDPAFEEVARFSPLTPAEEADFEAARDALRAEAEAEGRDDLLPFIDSGALALFATETGLEGDALDRFRELQPDHDERVVVYVGPPIDGELPP